MTRGSFSGEQVKNVIPDTAAMASCDLLGHSVDLRSACDGLIFITVDLHAQLLNLELFRPLEIFLVFNKLINRPFLSSVIVDPGLKGALHILFIHEG